MHNQRREAKSKEISLQARCCVEPFSSERAKANGTPHSAARVRTPIETKNEFRLVAAIPRLGGRGPHSLVAAEDPGGAARSTSCLFLTGPRSACRSHRSSGVRGYDLAAIETVVGAAFSGINSCVASILSQTIAPQTDIPAMGRSGRSLLRQAVTA